MDTILVLLPRANAARVAARAAAPSIDLVENYTQLVKSKATKEK